MIQSLVILLLFVVCTCSASTLRGGETASVIATANSRSYSRGSTSSDNKFSKSVSTISVEPRSEKIGNLIKAFHTLVIQLKNDQDEDSTLMGQLKDQCVHEQERLAYAANFLEQDISGLTHRSDSLKKQILYLTSLEKDVQSEPTTESYNETKIAATEGKIISSLLVKRLQDLRFKSEQTLERHAIKLKGLQSIQSSAQALADGCLQGLSLHETRTLSRRQVGYTIDFAERQIGIAVKKAENQASLDLRRAAQAATKIGGRLVSNSNIDQLTDKITKLASSQVMNDASDEAKKQLAGIVSEINIDNLHDHANIRSIFDQLAQLRQAVAIAADAFEQAAANSTKQRTIMEAASANILKLEEKQQLALDGIDSQHAISQQQDEEATDQQGIANSSSSLMKIASHLTNKVHASSLLRAKAAGLLLHELPAAQSILAATRRQLRIVNGQRNPGLLTQLKEMTEKVAQLRKDLGRAEDDSTFTHWLTKGNTRSKHPSPSIIRNQLHTVEIKRNNLQSMVAAQKNNKTIKSSGIGESSADLELEMSYRLSKQKVHSAMKIVKHIEKTVQLLLKHAQDLESQVVEGITSEYKVVGTASSTDPFFASFKAAFQDDDDYEENLNTTHVESGRENRLSEWKKFLSSLNDRKSFAISSQMRAILKAKQAKETISSLSAIAVHSKEDIQRLRIVRDHVFSTTLQSALAKRAVAREDLERATEKRDDALHFMQASAAAEEKELTLNKKISSSKSSRPLSFESKLADIVDQVILKSGSVSDQVIEKLLRKASVELVAAKSVGSVAGKNEISENDSSIQLGKVVHGIKGWTDGDNNEQWAEILHTDEKNIRLALYKMLRTLQRGNYISLKAAKTCAEVDIIHADIINPGYSDLKRKINKPHNLMYAERISQLRKDVAYADGKVREVQNNLAHARLAQANPLFFKQNSEGGWRSAWGSETIGAIEKRLETAKEAVVTSRVKLKEMLSKNIENAESLKVEAESMYNTTKPKTTEYQQKMNECRELVAKLPRNGVGLPRNIQTEAEMRHDVLRNAYKVWIRHLMEREKEEITKETKDDVEKEIYSYNNKQNMNAGNINSNNEHILSHAKQLSLKLIQDISSAVHVASSMNTNSSGVASNFKNIENVLNLTGFVQNSFNGPSKQPGFDMDGEIALLHNEDSELARNGVSMLKERLSSSGERVMWGRFEGGNVPEEMINKAIDRGRSYVRSNSIYQADVAARSGLAHELMSHLAGIKRKVKSLNHATSLWKQLNQEEEKLKRARAEEDKVTLTSVSTNAKDLADHLKRLESAETLSDKSVDQKDHSAAIRIKNGVVIEFDDVEAYEQMDNQLILNALRNVLANQFGWSLPASWITTSSTFSADDGSLSASVRFDVPNLSMAKRIVSFLRVFAGKNQVMSKNIAIKDGENDIQKFVKMSVRWCDGISKDIEIGTVPTSQKQQTLESLLAPISDERGEDSTTNASSADSTNRSDIREKANDDWYLDLKNDNGDSPARNSILLATVWEGPQMAATFFDLNIAPFASAERVANQAQQEQILAQKHLITSELELKTLNIREEAINKLLDAVGQLSLDGKSTFVDDHVLHLASVLTYSNLHGTSSVEYARSILSNIIETNIKDVEQTTIDAKKAEEYLMKLHEKQLSANLMESPIFDARDQANNDNEKRNNIMKILEHDKLYQQLNKASNLLESIKASEDFKNFPKLSESSLIQLDESTGEDGLFNSIKNKIRKKAQQAKEVGMNVGNNIKEKGKQIKEGAKENVKNIGKVIVKPFLKEKKSAAESWMEIEKSKKTEVEPPVKKAVKSVQKNVHETVDHPILNDMTKKIKDTMTKLKLGGEKISGKLLSEAKNIETFQQGKDKDVRIEVEKVAKMNIEKLENQLKNEVENREKNEKVMKDILSKQNKTIQEYKYNLTQQTELYHNLSVAVNLTANTTFASKVLPNSTTLISKKITNRSQCDAPCPCDDLGFSLCECCGTSFPTVDENKEKAKKAEHLITTTSEGLRRLKHESQKLRAQCKADSAAVNDAKYNKNMLSAALSEAVKSLGQYRDLARTTIGDQSQEELTGYILAAELQVKRVTVSRNTTIKRLNAAFEVAGITCAKWKVAHSLFEKNVIAARKAKVDEVHEKLQDQIDEVKIHLQHQKYVSHMTKTIIQTVNTTLLPLLNKMVTNIENDAIDGFVPASVFGLVDTAKTIQKNRNNLKKLLLGEVAVSQPERNISVLELFLERSKSCSKEVQNNLLSLDQSIQAKNSDDDRQKRIDLIHLDNVLKGENAISIVIIAQNLSNAGNNYRLGNYKNIELEKITELKHLPYKPVKDVDEEDVGKDPVERKIISRPSTTTTVVNVTKPKTITLHMPGVDSKNFDQDASIEEIDAMVLDEAILSKKKINISRVSKIDNKINNTNVTLTVTTSSSIQTNNTKIETEAEKIMYSTPPLLIGETWSKLRKNGQVNIGLLKGAVDNVKIMLSSSRKELDTAVNDYCGALNRHVMLDLEAKFVQEQIQNGANSVSMKHASNSLPVLRSKPLSALHQIVEDILLQSRNGSKPLKPLVTEMNNVSKHFYMLVPTATGSKKEPKNQNGESILTSSTNVARKTSESYVAQYYSEIRNLEQKTLKLMTAKENAFETYTEELLLQHMDLHESAQKLEITDAVSSAQTKASKATDDMANALTNQMQIKIANRGNAAKMKKADLRYSKSVQHASKMEKELLNAKQTSRRDLTLRVRNKIFACALKTKKRFTHIIHQRVALAQSRADEKARKAREARLRLFFPSANKTKNATKRVKPRPETEREILVRLLKEAMSDVLNAKNITSRLEASKRAAELQIRLDELDELVAARNAVANSTEERASAGSTGNSTMIERFDKSVQIALHNLSMVLSHQYARRHPTKKVHLPKNQTSKDMLFIAKCMGNDAKIRLENATRGVVAVPTTESIHHLIIAKNAVKTKKRICRLKLSIKTAMEMLRKTTDREDRIDIKNEIKQLAHKISLLTIADKKKATEILHGPVFTNTTSDFSNKTKGKKKMRVEVVKDVKIVFNHSKSVVNEALEMSKALKLETKNVMQIKHMLQEKNNGESTTPDVKTMKSMVDVNKQVKESLSRIKLLLQKQKSALRTTSPKEVEKIAILKKNIVKSEIEARRAQKNSVMIDRYVQDSAQAVVVQAKVEVENAVLETKKARLGVSKVPQR